MGHYLAATGEDAGKCKSCEDVDVKSVLLAVIAFIIGAAIFVRVCVDAVRAAAKYPRVYAKLRRLVDWYRPRGARRDVDHFR